MTRGKFTLVDVTEAQSTFQHCPMRVLFVTMTMNNDNFSVDCDNETVTFFFIFNFFLWALFSPSFNFITLLYVLYLIDCFISSDYWLLSHKWYTDVNNTSKSAVFVYDGLFFGSLWMNLNSFGWQIARGELLHPTQFNPIVACEIFLF